MAAEEYPLISLDTQYGPITFLLHGKHAGHVQSKNWALPGGDKPEPFVVDGVRLGVMMYANYYGPYPSAWSFGNAGPAMVWEWDAGSGIQVNHDTLDKVQSAVARALGDEMRENPEVFRRAERINQERLVARYDYQIQELEQKIAAVKLSQNAAAAYLARVGQEPDDIFSRA